MSPYEIVGLAFISAYYCCKWWRKREKKIKKGIRRYQKQLADFELCEERHKKKGGIVSGQFNTLLRPGIRDLFEWSQLNSFMSQRTGLNDINVFKDCEFLYPGKIIMVDPAFTGTEEELYGDEYWRILKEKIRREREDD